MKILHLTLKRKWFDMILLCDKKEEYREIKPYWSKRFNLHQYTHIKFRNGYSKKSPWLIIELKRITIGHGVKRWGAPERKVYILSLGNIWTDFRSWGINV